MHSLLFLASAVLAAPADSGFAAESRQRMEAELAAFATAHSTGYLGRFYLEIADSAGLQSGFGEVRERKSRGRADTLPKYEIALKGRIFLPDRNTRVVANGIPGTPTARGWEFRMETGRIEAFAEIPWGPLARVVFAGESFDVRGKKGKTALREYLKHVPEAYDRSDSDILDAIRYFNAAPETEWAANTSYAADLEEELKNGTPGYTGRLDRAVRARLALNSNDLPTLGIQAQALCAEGRTAEAEPVLRAAEKIRPDYFRIPLARAACMEQQGRHAEAETQVRLARGSIGRDRLADLILHEEDLADTRIYDSALAARGDRNYRIEWDALGFGIPQSILGTSLSLHARLGRFAASLSLGTGFSQFADPPAGFPAVDFRFHFPGRRFRAYLGYGAINPFDFGPGHHFLFFGPEAGISQDIGAPLGFLLHYGMSLATVIDRDAGKGRSSRETLYLPHGSLGYAF